jgi:type IV fimbrial biogenesis protein FimT
MDVMKNIDKKLRAFTLIELLVTLSIVAILAAMAAPSFSNMIKDNTMAAQVNSLLANLNVSRSEAVRRLNTVILCPTSNQTSCANQWSDGWMSFVDANDNGSLDAGEEIIKNYDASDTNLTITYGRTKVKFSKDGTSIGTNGTFTFCDSRGNNYRKGLVVNNSGRAIASTSGGTLQSCP